MGQMTGGERNDHTTARMILGCFEWDSELNLIDSGLEMIR